MFHEYPKKTWKHISQWASDWGWGGTQALVPIFFINSHVPGGLTQWLSHRKPVTWGSPKKTIPLRKALIHATIIIIFQTQKSNKCFLKISSSKKVGSFSSKTWFAIPHWILPGSLIPYDFCGSREPTVNRVLGRCTALGEVRPIVVERLHLKGHQDQKIARWNRSETIPVVLNNKNGWKMVDLSYVSPLKITIFVHHSWVYNGQIMMAVQRENHLSMGILSWAWDNWNRRIT